MKKNILPIPLPSKLSDPRFHPFINKRILFTFFGKEISLFLSHALFSSYDVDDGTKLLLKTIAQKIDCSEIRTVIDAGCGIGVIGICLKKRFPQISLTATDRDAYALTCTAENCGQNGISEITLKNTLGLAEIVGPFDMLVSNIPAKMGDSALNDFIRSTIRILGPNGVSAVVVIASISDQIRKSISMHNGVIHHAERTDRHTVFHYSRESSPLPIESAPESGTSTDYFLPYIRPNAECSHERFTYAFQSVYDLPDFDTVGYQSQLAWEMVKNKTLHGTCLFWNPGQGHLPVLINKKNPATVNRYILASNDLLQLKISEKNLITNTIDPRSIHLRPVSFISDIKDSAHHIFILPENIPLVPWRTILMHDLRSFFRGTGYIVIADTTSSINGILKHADGFIVEKKITRRGFTGLLMKQR